MVSSLTCSCIPADDGTCPSAETRPVSHVQVIKKKERTATRLLATPYSAIEGRNLSHYARTPASGPRICTPATAPRNTLNPL